MNRVTLKNRSGAKIVSILSGKGGVGKSVIAFNLAYQMAADGSRVLLVDADPSCGNQHILAGVHAEFGLAQYRAGSLSLSEAVTGVTVSLDLLTQTTNAPADDSEVIATAQFIGALRRDGSNYDTILIDHSSGISQAATIMAHGSDMAVIVLVPELTSISDAYGLYKFLITTNRNLECRLLLNRCESADEAKYIRAKMLAATDRFLGKMPGFAGWLPEDPTVRKAVAVQKSISVVNPSAPFVQSLYTLARLIKGETVGADELLNSKINNHPATADKGNEYTHGYNN